jgi:hypothetical protein
VCGEARQPDQMKHTLVLFYRFCAA